jgi:GDSL-like Lipase/Acylhydrolase family
VRRTFVWFTLALGIFVGAARAADAPRPFMWNDGDRVVLIGDTLIERDQKYGYLETILTAQNPDKTLTFRNLGWSGDTVRGLSRARFGPPAEGWQHLIEHVNALKPTVLILGYGMADSFGGEAGLPAFASGLNQLIDAVSASKPRLIFLSPLAHEDLGRPLPDPSKHNLALPHYRDAVQAVAAERHGWFVDLFEPTLSAHDYGIAPLTDNGLHLTAFGSWYLATTIARELAGGKTPGWNARIELRPTGATYQGINPKNLESSRDHFRFETATNLLPTPGPPRGAPKDVVWGEKRSFRVGGLTPGSYLLKVDGQTVADGRDDHWSKSVPITRGPDYDQVEKLRQAINRKNELYFYRWRPQNETYLFGFRKHEQGNNAREIPQFDPLVDEQEKRIATLKKPVDHVYELTREADDGAK